MDNENIINNDKIYDFESNLVMTEKDYMEFGKVNYSKISVVFIIEFAVMALFSIQFGVIHFLFNSNEQYLLLLNVIILFFMIFILYKHHSALQKGYKRIIFSQGEQNFSQSINFGEKIVTQSKLSVPKEYDYSVITAIKETENFYLLQLQYNLYLIVEKNIKSNLNNVDFISYILSKSQNIKNKTVQNVKNKKLISFIFMCLTAVLLICNIIISFL